LVDRHWLVIGPRSAELGARLGHLVDGAEASSAMHALAGVLADEGETLTNLPPFISSRVPRVLVADRAQGGNLHHWLEEGVHSVLLIDMPAGRLEAALRLIASGERFAPMDLWAAPAESPDLSRLTHRQQEVAKLIAAGLPNKEIAIRLGLREATVKVYVSALMRRIGARNRTEVAIKLRAA
jgi:DNA-binding NarL/FixJ family response regulator